MDNVARGILGDFEATSEQIRQAWEQAAVAAMATHRRNGVPVATWDWENGRVVLIPAEGIQFPHENSIAGVNTPDRTA